MKQTNNRFLVAATAAAIAAMLATASILTGCGGSGEESSETKVITETQIVTRVVNGVYTDEEGNILTDSDGEPLTAPSGTPDSDAKEKSESSQGSGSQSSGGGGSDKQSSGGSSDKQSSGKESSGGGSSDKQSSGGGSSDKQSSGGGSSDKQSSGGGSSDKQSSGGGQSSQKQGGGEGSGTLKLGGKNFSVGDTVTCTYSLTTPDAFINYQATLVYDSSVLKVTKAKMGGQASSGSVVNDKLDGKVKFNGINLGGYDYYDGGTFMTVTYEVVGSGSASPEIEWEIVTDDSNKAIVVNGELRSSFKITESYE